MPPKQQQSDSRALTLLFKKHKTTVFLMLQPHVSLETTKEKLLEALRARGLNDINGDPLPDDSFDIEFGELVDKSDYEKGWKLIQTDTPDLVIEGAPKKNKGKSTNESITLLEAGLENGHSIAFRFRKPGEGEDPGWDVIMPSYEDE
ncbi:uncharacterized protein N7515_007029 [Penicillium bovifimosum]|uniref:Uncharacterized protein n=1 Tax=Penicillium bovifimosum TaxID=126998 RepID=A0A9W9GVT8_9EURO|nr:uncharacterized protein N7515_007029 [Penicillium bovifimosum]KAJ5130990.1 hypothetical protein N7515_007029 [Penicillium bovifimosum]